MKQILSGFGLIIVLVLLCFPDAVAQRSKTKCPPKKSFWKTQKERKSLVKFPELVERQRDIAKEEKYYNKEKTGKPKVVPDKQIAGTFPNKASGKERDNRYIKAKKVRYRDIKTSSKYVASTNCPH